MHPQFYTPTCLVAVGSKVYIYVRGSSHSQIASYDVDTSAFATLPTFNFLRDVDGYTNAAFYKTIRAAAVGSSIYISARDNTGIRLASFNTITRGWSLLPTLSQFLSDAVWTQEQYYSTFQMLGKDTTLWLMMRGSAGVYLFSFDTEGNSWSFSGIPVITHFSDANGWGLPAYYPSFQMAAISTGLYIAARGSFGLVSFFYTIPTQVLSSVSIHTGYNDANGWNLDKYFRTVKITSCGDILLTWGRGTYLYQGIRLNTPAST